jgi:hypothetical protein
MDGDDDILKLPVQGRDQDGARETDVPRVPPSAGTGAPFSHRRAAQDDTYPAPGLLLTAGPLRTAALAIVAAPLLLIVLIFVQPWNAFHSSPPAYSDGTNPYAYSTFGQSNGGSDNSNPDPSTATPGAYAQPSDSPSDEPSPSPTDTGPEGVVNAYFAAINSGDYQTAWNLGGANLDTSYSDFTAGFATTRQDTVTILSVDGDQVNVNLDAEQNDGTHKLFTGSYTVSNGAITAAQLQPAD